MAFSGYLMKAVETGETFPLKYIQLDSYESIPNQREEIKAYRDENTRNLHRTTATGHKSKIVFTIKPNLHLKDKKVIQKWFTDAESNENQRKIKIQYWNDESNSYKTGSFYRTDITFKIKKVLSKDIIYDSLQITLVEY